MRMCRRQKVGGVGRAVQVDEAVISRRKNNKGRQVKCQYWLFVAGESNGATVSLNCNDVCVGAEARARLCHYRLCRSRSR